MRLRTALCRLSRQLRLEIQLMSHWYKCHESVWEAGGGCLYVQPATPTLEINGRMSEAAGETDIIIDILWPPPMLLHPNG